MQAVTEQKQPFVIPSAQNRRVGEITGKCADEFSGAVNKQAGRDSLAQGVHLKEDNGETAWLLLTDLPQVLSQNTSPYKGIEK
jgi:hypothetical protein